MVSRASVSASAAAWWWRGRDFRLINHLSQEEREVKVRDNAKQSRFEVQLDDGDLAFADYTVADGVMVFPHTEVPRKHEGQGIGGALARFALDAARERQLKVRPHCSFFARYMARHPETHDLLAPGEEAALESHKDA
jgi:uncharacterized protein